MLNFSFISHKKRMKILHNNRVHKGSSVVLLTTGQLASLIHSKLRGSTIKSSKYTTHKGLINRSESMEGKISHINNMLILRHLTK